MLKKKLFLCVKSSTYKSVETFWIQHIKAVSTTLTTFICLTKLNYSQIDKKKKYMSHVLYISEESNACDDMY